MCSGNVNDKAFGKVSSVARALTGGNARARLFKVSNAMDGARADLTCGALAVVSLHKAVGMLACFSVKLCWLGNGKLARLRTSGASASSDAALGELTKAAFAILGSAGHHGRANTGLGLLVAVLTRTLGASSFTWVGDGVGARLASSAAGAHSVGEAGRPSAPAAFAADARNDGGSASARLDKA